MKNNRKDHHGHNERIKVYTVLYPVIDDRNRFNPLLP
jgi:hypothetical protein